MYYHPTVDIKVNNAHKTDGCLISGSLYDTCKTVRLLREMRTDVTLYAGCVKYNLEDDLTSSKSGFSLPPCGQNSNSSFQEQDTNLSRIKCENV